MKRPIRGFSNDALAAILAHRWTGTVRELQNCIKRAVAASRSSYLTPADLRLALPNVDLDEPFDLATVRAAAEGRALRKAPAIANGNRDRKSTRRDSSN